MKETERNRRNAMEEISTKIFGSEQQLPIGTKKFWAASENKMKFQQLLTDWLTKKYSVFLYILVDCIMKR